MKKLLLATALIGSLNAASVAVMTPQIRTHCEMRLLEQDLGSVCGNLPFNSDFKCESLTEESVEMSLTRLTDPSMLEMLGIWRHSGTLGLLSTNIIILLNQNISHFDSDRKKDHMKEIIINLNTLWQLIPLF